MKRPVTLARRPLMTEKTANVIPNATITIPTLDTPYGQLIIACNNSRCHCVKRKCSVFIGKFVYLA